MAHALIVEDEQVIRRGLVSQMKAQGHSCVEAAGFEEAKAALVAHAFDFVLLDLKIPFAEGDPVHESNGERFILILREHPVNANAGLVVVTSVDDCTMSAECMDRGADYYTPKDFRRKSLADCIEIALRKRATRMGDGGVAQPQKVVFKTLSFENNKIMLDDIEICSCLKTIQAKALRCLAMWDDPNVTNPTGKHIAGEIVDDMTQGNKVNRAFSSITEKIQKALQERNLQLGEDDFIINHRGISGYRLAPGIEVLGLKGSDKPAAASKTKVPPKKRR